jgi:hypothetical protein
MIAAAIPKIPKQRTRILIHLLSFFFVIMSQIKAGKTKSARYPPKALPIFNAGFASGRNIAITIGIIFVKKTTKHLGPNFKVP